MENPSHPRAAGASQSSPPVPSTDLELIDQALELIREVCHRHQASPLARQHLEHASALLREAWIEISGQQARPPADVFQGVTSFYDLLESCRRIEGKLDAKLVEP